MADNKKTYTIGGKKYTQKPLVWGQIKQLKDLMKGVEFPADVNVMSTIDALEDTLPKVVAIVLREDGKTLKQKDVDALAASCDEHLELETIVDIVEDFFLCNRTTLLFEKLKKVFGDLMPKVDLTK